MFKSGLKIMGSEYETLQSISWWWHTLLTVWIRFSYTSNAIRIFDVVMKLCMDAVFWMILSTDISTHKWSVQCQHLMTTDHFNARILISLLDDRVLLFCILSASFPKMSNGEQEICQGAHIGLKYSQSPLLLHECDHAVQCMYWWKIKYVSDCRHIWAES